MLGFVKTAVAQAHASRTAHSEFWRFVGYATATTILLKQGLGGQANWAVVALFISYLAIVAGSSTAVQLFSMLRSRADADSGT